MPGRQSVQGGNPQHHPDVAQADRPIAFRAVHVPASVKGNGRTLTLTSVGTSAASTRDRTDVNLAIAITNESGQSFLVNAQDFFISAAADFFGPASIPTSGLVGRLAPGAGKAGRIALQIPTGALPYAALVYKPKDAAVLLSLPLNATSNATAPAATSGTQAGTTSINAIEDNFTRANQVG